MYRISEVAQLRFRETRRRSGGGGGRAAAAAAVVGVKREASGGAEEWGGKEIREKGRRDILGRWPCVRATFNSSNVEVYGAVRPVRGGRVSSLIRQRAGPPRCIARGCRLGLGWKCVRPTGN